MIEITYPGEPMPAPRPRLGWAGAYNKENYSIYKDGLATFIRAKFGFLVWDVPKVGDKNREKFIKNNRYRLFVEVYRTKKGDWDNFGKTVSDAIQASGIIADDEQIDDGRVVKHLVKENPRLFIRLERMESPKK